MTMDEIKKEQTRLKILIADLKQLRTDHSAMIDRQIIDACIKQQVLEMEVLKTKTNQERN